MGNDKLSLKKFLVGICAAGLLMTGCGSDGGEVKHDSQEKITKIGMITHLNASEQKINDVFAKIEKSEKICFFNFYIVYTNKYTKVWRFEKICLSLHLEPNFYLLWHH